MITTADIQHLAKLSRMELTEAEATALTKEVDSILGYVGQIKDATGDMAQVISPLHNVMRDDVVTNTPGEYTQDILNNAPKREGDYLEVKKIL